MVKLPQSSLGYCVDGDLTRVVPVRNKKDCDDKIISLKIIKKTVPPSTAMNESFQNSLKPEDVEEIKVAVKKGELSNALLVVEEMMSRQKCYSRGRTELELLVLCLFALNIEKRTPVYFAALTGRTKIVKFLLCLLIMHRRHSWMNESLDPFLMLSLQEWLNKLGYIDSFKSMDLDACILNSLNQSTRNAISVEKFTLRKIVSFAISTTSACCDRARVVDIVMKQTAKRKHMPCSPARPLLNTDDIRFDAKYHHNRRARFYDEDRNDRVNGDRETAGLEFTTQETNASSRSPSNTKPRSDAQQSQREHEDLARALSLSLHPHEQRMSQDEMIKLALEQSLVDCPGILTPSWAGHDNITAEGDVDSSVVELSQEGDNLRLNNKTDALIDSEYIVLQNGPERYQ
ncbi:hypothetical protein ACA910_002677 [Epithemia clementina (nom. ined.)]